MGQNQMERRRYTKRIKRKRTMPVLSELHFGVAKNLKARPCLLFRRDSTLPITACLSKFLCPDLIIFVALGGG